MSDDPARDDIIKAYLPKFRALIKPDDIAPYPTEPRASDLELDAAIAHAKAAIGKATVKGVEQDHTL